MRWLGFYFCCFLLVPISASSQMGGHPKPPGITTGDTLANAPLEKPVENRNRQINVQQVKQEAEELRTLANALPAQIDQMTNNQLPKDLSDNLKKIEKLAKHLRSEVTP
jgi:hypothetical protein